MSNYAFQSVGRMLKLVTALAIHLIKCAAKANCLLVLSPQPKGMELVISRILPHFIYKFKNQHVKVALKTIYKKRIHVYNPLIINFLTPFFLK